jgi:hypothetical protein
MIISETKPVEKIIDSLKGLSRIFLIGCGDCATQCKTGGEEQLAEMKARLEGQGKTVTGLCVPPAACVAAKLKTELAKQMKQLREAEAVLVFACGSGVQSVKDNDRLGLAVLPGCNSISAAVLDGKGDLYEKCSMCSDCVLDITAAICPVTLCPKGILNGPCGGMDKGKCEQDKERDCAWVLIYKELDKRGSAARLSEIRQPRDYKKATRPHAKRFV